MPILAAYLLWRMRFSRAHTDEDACSRAAPYQRLTDRRPAAPTAGTDDRCAAHPGDWHPRRLQCHLVGTALPPGGKLVSLEIDEHHAAVARSNIAAAGLAKTVEVHVGPALATLTAMQQAGEAPFDLVFIDADKDGYVAYLEQAVALVRSGGLVLADNTLRPDMLDPAGDGGAKRYNAAVAKHPALVSTVVPVLRSEGLGLTISIKQTLP